MFKILFVLLIVYFMQVKGYGLGQELESDQIWASCAEENGINLKDLGADDKLEQLFEQKQYKCFYKCVHLKKGIINEAGEANYDKIAENYMNVVKPCYEGINEADLCEKSHKVQICLLNKIKDII